MELKFNVIKQVDGRRTSNTKFKKNVINQWSQKDLGQKEIPLQEL